MGKEEIFWAFNLGDGKYPFQNEAQSDSANLSTFFNHSVKTTHKQQTALHHSHHNNFSNLFKSVKLPVDSNKIQSA